MTIILNSLAGFSSTVKLQSSSKSFADGNHGRLWGPCSQKRRTLLFSSMIPIKDLKWGRCLSAFESKETSTNSTDTENKTLTDDQSSEPKAMPLSSSETSSSDGTTDAASSIKKSTPKRTPLTAREKLRAARVLSRYADSKPLKRETGSKMFDALRETDKGKRRSGLPEAPSNMFDDSKRGMPKQGLTFDFPGGNDLLLIVFSFVFISSVMFATTYVVWKAGAIHFNEY